MTPPRRHTPYWYAQEHLARLRSRLAGTLRRPVEHQQRTRTRRGIGGTIALTATLGLVLGLSPTPAAAATWTNVMTTEINTPAMQAKIQQEVLSEVNRMRSQPRTCGADAYPAVPPLKLNQALNQASFTHSQNMATLGFFGHLGQDGKQPWHRAEDAGYVGYQHIAENIAAGYVNAAEVVAALMTSASHCVNIMSARAEDIGIAVFYAPASPQNPYRSYWTQTFGKLRIPTTPTPTPTPTSPAAPKAMKTATPKITGTAKVGNTLTASPGSWTPSDVRFSYQWYRSGKTISGATGKTYQLVAADRSQTITVKVTGTRSGYTTASKTSAKTKKIATGSFAVKTPKISGKAKVGVPLTVATGNWGQSGVKFKLQWYRNGKKISGATKTSYTPTSKDRGKKLTVKVTGSKTGFTTASKTSGKTAKVAYGTLSAPAPRITGAPEVGQKLKVTAGKWQPGGVKLKYQWFSNGKKIKKATKTSLTLTKTLKGKTITVKVTGSKSGYKKVTKTSAKTARIA